MLLVVVWVVDVFLMIGLRVFVALPVSEEEEGGRRRRRRYYCEAWRKG